MVITGLTRNQLYSVEYRGFESHRFRQTPPKGGFCFFAVVFGALHLQLCCTNPLLMADACFMCKHINCATTKPCFYESHSLCQRHPIGVSFLIRWIGTTLLCLAIISPRTHFSWLTLVLCASTPTALLRNFVSTNPTASAKPHQKVGFVFWIIYAERR